MGVDPAYAAYVLPAYGLSAAVLLWMLADTLARARRWRREAEHRQAEPRHAEGGRAAVKRLAVIAPLLVLGALIVLFGAFSLRRDPFNKPDALVGRPLPQLTLPTLVGGQAAPLRASVEGPTFVNVFASWCTPCEVEHPELMTLSRSGVRVVGLAYKDDPAKTAAFLQELGDPFAIILVDRDGRAGLELGITGVPETYLVGADGVIRAKHAGPLTPEVAGTLLAQARSLD